VPWAYRIGRFRHEPSIVVFESRSALRGELLDDSAGSRSRAKATQAPIDSTPADETARLGAGPENSKTNCTSYLRITL
jgi:hypothetical protein